MDGFDISILTMINFDDSRTFSDFSISIFSTLQYPFEDISTRVSAPISLCWTFSLVLSRKLFYQNYLNCMEDQH